MPVPIPRNHSSYKWKFASLDPYLSISFTPQPPVTTCYSLFLWVWLYFKISQISEHTVFVFFSLAYFTCIISSRLIHVLTNGRIFFFVMAKEFPLYVYTYPTFYPFIHWQALWLFPYLGYCEWESNDIGVKPSLLYRFYFLLIYTQKWDCWILFEVILIICILSEKRKQLHFIQFFKCICL